MRCNNCGFENAEDATHCIKCKTALDSKAVKQAPPRASSEAPPVPKKETTYAGTITDSQLADVRDKIQYDEQASVKQEGSPATIAGQTPGAAIEEKSPLVKCPHADCGYPYSSELKVCPRCQRGPVTPATTPNQTNIADQTNTADQTAGPARPPKPFAGTIDPYRTKTIIDTPAPTPAPPICYLQPVAKDGEPGPPQQLSFTLDHPAIELNPNNLSHAAIGPNHDTHPAIQLNRDNLDPGNPSITGKVQAELTFEDGAWQLKDSSELQTTFLLASTQTLLKDGDILLIGDRKFIFSTSPAPDK